MSTWIAKLANLNYGLLAICSMLLFSSGCSKEVQYSVGLVTMKVDGKIELTSSGSSTPPFILTRKQHRTLIQTSSGYIYRITASIVHPDEKGSYTIKLENDVYQLEMQVIAQGYRSVQQIFHRTLGIGSYHFDTQLQKDPNWRETYYLLVKPALSEYITEQRYKLDDGGQIFLSDWFSQVEKDISKNKKD